MTPHDPTLLIVFPPRLSDLAKAAECYFAHGLKAVAIAGLDNISLATLEISLSAMQMKHTKVR
jgi:hypothetical protein